MNELTRVNKVFEGEALAAYLWEEQPVWVAKEVGRLMGYGEDGKGLLRSIQDWKEEMISGVDFEVLEGERLAKFKATRGEVLPESDRSPSLLILKESGFHAVCLKTDKPIGVRLRRWLATEVMPSLIRTGSYQSKPQSIKEIFQAHKPAVLLAMALKASEGDIEAAQIYLKLGRPSHHKKPTSEPNLPKAARTDTKTAQIEALLLSGLSRKDISGRGFATKALVYKVAARLKSKRQVAS